MNKIILKILYFPRNIGIKIIEWYQKHLSFDHSPKLQKFKEKHKNFTYVGCKYYPSCSEYTKQCISKFGLIIGSILGFWRILRCNPFSKGGFDPIPEKKLKTKNQKK